MLYKNYSNTRITVLKSSCLKVVADCKRVQSNGFETGGAYGHKCIYR